MAKIDWKRIKKQYVSEVAETGVDLKTFCVRNGLIYSTARKYLTIKLLEENGITKTGKGIRTTEQNRTEEQNEDSAEISKGNTSRPNSRKPKQQKARKQSIDEKPKGTRGGKRDGAGAPKGNRNAFVHGLMTKAFGDLVKYSHQVDDEFKLEVHKLASLQALQSYTKYKEDLEKLTQEIEQQIKNGKPPTEVQVEELSSLERRMTSSLSQVTYHAGKLEYMENQMANRAYTHQATAKTRAQTTHVVVDTELKQKSIGLADAKTEQSKAQTALAKHELTAREKETMGDDDDLGMTLDEVMDQQEDEILERFRENGGELHLDDE